MHARAQELIARLGLSPHPEGGRYRRVVESKRTVQRVEGGPRRLALTSIYYLLLAGEESAWHRVESDEVWHFYEGAPLALAVAPPDGATTETLRLGPPAIDSTPVYCVPAGWWQCARALGEFALVGCTVAPGFEFEDFTLLRDLAVGDPLHARLATSPWRHPTDAPPQRS